MYPINESFCDSCKTTHAKCSVCNKTSMLFEHSLGLFCFDCYYSKNINWSTSSIRQKYINLCSKYTGDQT